MTPSVARPIGDRPIEGDDSTTRWINDELLIVLRQLRTAANARAAERTTASTVGTGIYARLWTSAAMPSNAAWKVTADIVGISTSGAPETAMYLLTACFQSVGTVVSQVGATVTLDVFKSTAAIDARFGADATARTVFLEARDDGISPMTWTATPRTTEAFTG